MKPRRSAGRRSAARDEAATAVDGRDGGGRRRTGDACDGRRTEEGLRREVPCSIRDGPFKIRDGRTDAGRATAWTTADDWPQLAKMSRDCGGDWPRRAAE